MSIKPKLGYFDMTMIIVSLVIGIGIFRTPAIVADKAGSPLMFFAAWILGGIISICGALTFAEIGSRYPVAGGFYKIFSHCYHPAYAFMLNWSIVTINAASSVSVAVVGSEYINPVLPASLHSPTGIKLTATLVILALFTVNYLGIKMGSRAQNLLSMLKIAMIAVFCLAIFGPHQPTTTAFIPVDKGGFDLIKIIGVCLISVFFTYGGYQQTINFGADIKEPEKNIPRSILTGMGIVILLYITINCAYYFVLGFEGLQHSKLLAADLARSIFGERGSTFTSVVIFCSVLGFLNTSFMSNPRVYYAMADDRILPEIFKRVNTQTQVQEFSLVFFTAVMLLFLFLFGTFEKILNYIMFIDSIAMVTAAAAIFIFRHRAKAHEVATGEKTDHIYRIKLFPLVPLVFMFVLLMVSVNVLLTDTISALYGMVIFAAGFPLYKLMQLLVAKTDKRVHS